MIKKVLHILARPEIFFFACLWLMVLLTLGTLAQKDLGLYQAQRNFFSCFVTWLGGWMPVPGGYTTLSLVFVGLLAKTISQSSFKKNKLGIFVIHLGAGVLLLGGLLTAVFSEEGSMVIPEGATVGYVSDYHHRELAVIETTRSDVDQVTAFDVSEALNRQILTHVDLPFRVSIENFFTHVSWQKRTSPLAEAHGFAQNFELRAQPAQSEEEKNIAGLSFRLQGIDDAHDGEYAIFEGMPVDQTLQVGQRSFVFQLRRVQRYLPFQIQLIDFEQQFHPGTEMARSYRSVVNVIDDHLIQRQVIQMNEPLRYKGYTFFQSSFMDLGMQETTVLAVVSNVGAWFPYVASVIMFLGLLMNLVVRVPDLFKRRGTA